LIDPTVDLHGETIGDIFKGFLRSLGCCSLDRQADQTQTSHQENDKKDHNGLEKFSCDVGKCVV